MVADYRYIVVFTGVGAVLGYVQVEIGVEIHLEGPTLFVENRDVRITGKPIHAADIDRRAERDAQPFAGFDGGKPVGIYIENADTYVDGLGAFTLQNRRALDRSAHGVFLEESGRESGPFQFGIGIGAYGIVDDGVPLLFECRFDAQAC